jgi:hypothetical protein
MLHRTHSWLCCKSTHKYFTITLLDSTSYLKALPGLSIYTDKHLWCNNAVGTIRNSVGVWKIQYAVRCTRQRCFLISVYYRGLTRNERDSIPSRARTNSLILYVHTRSENPFNLIPKGYTGIKPEKFNSSNPWFEEYSYIFLEQKAFFGLKNCFCCSRILGEQLWRGWYFTLQTECKGKNIYIYETGLSVPLLMLSLQVFIILRMQTISSAKQPRSTFLWLKT